MFLIILFRVALLKYFIIISPIIILLLVKVCCTRDLKIHIFLSIILIAFLTSNYFITTNANGNQIQADLEKITNDYNNQHIISGPFEAPKFAQFLWQEKPYFIWFQDYQASINNESTIREYNIEFNSKIPLKNKLKISAYFNRFNNKTYENIILVTQLSKEDFPELENYNLDKCYEVLCVYS
ncbi:hypothetical protein CMI42_01875 [Candidatus Pacearchaeota archaeon]|nr:hypothetical protein [Candidatus Pacearchaeota archaeon]